MRRNPIAERGIAVLRCFQHRRLLVFLIVRFLTPDGHSRQANLYIVGFLYIIMYFQLKFHYFKSTYLYSNKPLGF